MTLPRYIVPTQVIEDMLFGYHSQNRPLPIQHHGLTNNEEVGFIFTEDHYQNIKHAVVPVVKGLMVIEILVVLMPPFVRNRTLFG
jgi:hypothetical protein